LCCLFVDLKISEDRDDLAAPVQTQLFEHWVESG
jgi:hypothetical protein